MMDHRKDECCKNCPLRCIGCHGHNPNGSCRCPRWAEHEARVEQDMKARRECSMITDYMRTAVKRGIQIKERGR